MPRTAGDGLFVSVPLEIKLLRSLKDAVADLAAQIRQVLALTPRMHVLVDIDAGGGDCGRVVPSVFVACRSVLETHKIRNFINHLAGLPPCFRGNTHTSNPTSTSTTTSAAGAKGTNGPASSVPFNLFAAALIPNIGAAVCDHSGRAYLPTDLLSNHQIANLLSVCEQPLVRRRCSSQFARPFFV